MAVVSRLRNPTRRQGFLSGYTSRNKSADVSKAREHANCMQRRRGQNLRRTLKENRVPLWMVCQAGARSNDCWMLSERCACRQLSGRRWLKSVPSAEIATNLIWSGQALSESALPPQLCSPDGRWPDHKSHTPEHAALRPARPQRPPRSRTRPH